MVAGGSGMAPVLGVLRQLAAEGCERPVRFYYGAREERDLFALDEIAALGERLADFRFIPVTGRFVHEADRRGARRARRVHVRAAADARSGRGDADGRGVDPARIFQDKFTTSADAPAEAGAPTRRRPRRSPSVTSPGSPPPRAGPPCTRT